MRRTPPRGKRSRRGSGFGSILPTRFSIGSKSASNRRIFDQDSLKRRKKRRRLRYLLDVEPLDLGSDVRAVGLELVEADENRAPVRGPDAAKIWSRVLTAAAATTPWALDFFSHLDRVKDYCQRHEIGFREASHRSLVIPAPALNVLEPLLDRFQSETFGARAGDVVSAGDPEVEGDRGRRGGAGFQNTLQKYFF